MSAIRQVDLNDCPEEFYEAVSEDEMTPLYRVDPDWEHFENPNTGRLLIEWFEERGFAASRIAHYSDDSHFFVCGCGCPDTKIESATIGIEFVRGGVPAMLVIEDTSEYPYCEFASLDTDDLTTATEFKLHWVG